MLGQAVDQVVRHPTAVQRPRDIVESVQIGLLPVRLGPPSSCSSGIAANAADAPPDSFEHRSQASTHEAGRSGQQHLITRRSGDVQSHG